MRFTFNCISRSGTRLAIPCASFRRITQYSNFRMITANFSGVQILGDFKGILGIEQDLKLVANPAPINAILLIKIDVNVYMLLLGLMYS